MNIEIGTIELNKKELEQVDKQRLKLRYNYTQLAKDTGVSLSVVMKFKKTGRIGYQYGIKILDTLGFKVEAPAKAKLTKKTTKKQ